MCIYIYIYTYVWIYVYLCMYSICHVIMFVYIYIYICGTWGIFLFQRTSLPFVAWAGSQCAGPFAVSEREINNWKPSFGAVNVRWHMGDGPMRAKRGASFLSWVNWLSKSRRHNWFFYKDGWTFHTSVLRRVTVAVPHFAHPPFPVSLVVWHSRNGMSGQRRKAGGCSGETPRVMTDNVLAWFNQNTLTVSSHNLGGTSCLTLLV